MPANWSWRAHPFARARSVSAHSGSRDVLASASDPTTVVRVRRAVVVAVATLGSPLRCVTSCRLLARLLESGGACQGFPVSPPARRRRCFSFFAAASTWRTVSSSTCSADVFLFRIATQNSPGRVIPPGVSAPIRPAQFMAGPPGPPRSAQPAARFVSFATRLGHLQCDIYSLQHE
eukprot:gene7035-biopygen2991